MKKSVLLLISVIYILSIVLVGFLGQQTRVYDEIIYVQDINVTCEGLPNIATEESDTDYVFRTKFTKGIVIELRSSVTPENANKTAVQYYGYETNTEGENPILSSVDTSEFNTLSLTFNRRGSMTIYVRSTDGKDITKSIFLRVLPNISI